MERGATRPSLPLVESYDGTFGAGRVLVRQYHELDAVVRQGWLLSLREAPDGSADPPVVIGGGTVPRGYDAQDLCMLAGETVPDGTLVQAGAEFEKE